MSYHSHQALNLVYICLLMFAMLASCSNDNIKHSTSRPTVNNNIIVSDGSKVMFARALEHLQQQEHEEAITLLEDLTKIEKNLAAPFVNLGIVYSRTGQTKKAEQRFIAALRLDVGHAVANNELALLYRKSGRFGAARAAYKNALTQNPDYLPARKNLGILCEIYLHDLACALEQYRAYLEYAPEEESIIKWALEVEQRIKLKNKSQSR